MKKIDVLAAFALAIAIGFSTWIGARKDPTPPDPLRDVRMVQAAKAKAIFDRHVSELVRMPRMAKKVVVQKNDGPTSLMASGCVPDNVYTEAEITTAFYKINPGARLWIGDEVFVPDYVMFCYQQSQKAKAAKLAKLAQK